MTGKARQTITLLAIKVARVKVEPLGQGVPRDVIAWAERYSRRLDRLVITRP